ncbi:hypothetical protein EVA_11195, partial [gut metagenome]
MLSEFTGMIGDVFMMMGALKFAGAFKAIQGIGEIILAIQDISKGNINFDNILTILRGISNLIWGFGLFTKKPKFAYIGMILQGVTMIVRELAEHWEEIKQFKFDGLDKTTLILGAIMTFVGIA